MRRSFFDTLLFSKIGLPGIHSRIQNGDSIVMNNNLEELKLAESWEYIQGGFLFLDETGEALHRANAELKRYIHTLSSVQPEAASLIARLKLDEPDQAFDEIPASLKQMLEADIAYLKEDPSVLDESFGSMAMAAFYAHTADYLKIPSDVPDRMKIYIRDTVHAQLPNIKCIG